jgi:putative FmdB family regulatory protein
MYEYRCPDCGAGFEMLRRMQEADTPAKCPRCSSIKATLQVSAFATGGCGTGGGGRFS